MPLVGQFRGLVLILGKSKKHTLVRGRGANAGLHACIQRYVYTVAQFLGAGGRIQHVQRLLKQPLRLSEITHPNF